MALPETYRWLETVGTLPRMVAEALALVGTAEVAGARDSPVIMGWAREVGATVVHDFYADAVPWCGLFLAVVTLRAGRTPPDRPLWALNWSRFGEEAGQPMLGDVLTFVRPGGGHCGLYVGEDASAYHVLGGNQADQVGFARIARSRLRAARRPAYRWRPKSVQVCRLGDGGRLSVDEA